ncbi:cyclic nucleotide-binding domain-containing protein [Bradyrhizobium sp.]|uniref:Crp/Fnr family transcriptional regulator n=1 Tax=Bradyrhizobium sp. TaxID=376 RepID=UPI0025BCABE5|nr:cyclic nucleotide-binding domain-containing protein [Bradyrhizobium sp.]
MREILEHCIGGIRQTVPAGAVVLNEGGRTGHLFVLIEGRLEVIKGDTVLASITEPGAVLGEMSVLLDQAHTATVRAASDSVIYEINDAASFLHRQPGVALLMARMLAQRLNAANADLADIKRQFAGQESHLAMVGDLLQSMIDRSPAQLSPGSDRKSDPRT